MTWNRNRLMSSRYNNYNITYAYGADGLRTEKHTGDDNFTYYYSGGKLVKLTSGSLTMKIYYGADGSPYAFDYGGTLYYYILNQLGDVIGLCNESGNIVVTYCYDAWGNIIRDYSNGYNSYLSRYNPLRYRGYIYDEETGLYYLQNRYYDPETGRFISADSYLVAGNHINSTNMFAYCLNNPIMYVDPSGSFAVAVDPTSLATATALIESIAAGLSAAFPPLVAVLIGVAIGAAILYASDAAYYDAVEKIDFASTASPPPPNKQTQVTSKTLYKKNGKNGYRIDVENPNPSKRPGQIHLQKDGTKYIYDIQNQQFVYEKTGEVAPNSIQNLLNEPKVIKAIAKGLKYLGY